MCRRTLDVPGIWRLWICRKDIARQALGRDEILGLQRDARHAQPAARMRGVYLQCLAERDCRTVRIVLVQPG